jgi:NAD-dependent dihydropyrimidine dehydrogenase PreA subunit
MPYKDIDAQRTAVRSSYLRNKERYKKRDNERKEAVRAQVNKLKSTTPCFDCAKMHPYYVMQFDHVRGEKLGEVSKFFANRQYQKMWDEIEKCELVCANCHATRTWQRLQADPR